MLDSSQPNSIISKLQILLNKGVKTRAPCSEGSIGTIKSVVVSDVRGGRSNWFVCGAATATASNQQQVIVQHDKRATTAAATSVV
jgi:hypothetical protein